MEACSSAHHWARELTKFGHTVKLMPPKYVKAYVKRGKTDAIDAAAICEAVTRPTMTFVRIKTAEQQGLCMLHGVRTKLVSQRTQVINALRGHLGELGLIAPQGILGVVALAQIVRDKSDARLPDIARMALEVLLVQIEGTDAQVAKLDAAILAEHKASTREPPPRHRARRRPDHGERDPGPHWRSQPVPEWPAYGGQNGAAWLGLVPEQASSGGKEKQRGISKKGDGYVRRLLVNGAMSVVRQARRGRATLRVDVGRTNILGSPPCWHACPTRRRRLRWPTRTHAFYGRSWCAASAISPAIATRIICQRTVRWLRKQISGLAMGSC